MKPAPSLRAGVITLREITLDDVDDMVEACRDDDTRTWTTVPHPYEREHAVAYAERTFGTPIDQEWPRWGIDIDGRWCGNVGLRMDGEGLADIGYLVAPWARRRGAGSVAVWLACDWAFREGGCRVVTWHAVAGNEASRALVAKVGFRVHRDVRRLAVVQRGGRVDVWTADLLPEDLVPLTDLLR